jgi:hypothetical protein
VESWRLRLYKACHASADHREGDEPRQRPD